MLARATELTDLELAFDVEFCLANDAPFCLVFVDCDLFAGLHRHLSLETDATLKDFVLPEHASLAATVSH